MSRAVKSTGSAKLLRETNRGGNLEQIYPSFLPLQFGVMVFFVLQTQEAERMIEKMEQDEDVLIERLKKVQDDQRKAYELLQESLES